MAAYYVNSNNATVWSTGSKSLGERRVPTRGYATAAAKAFVYEVTTGGTSAGGEPTWNTTVGGTTNDNTVVYTTREATSWANASAFIDYIWNNRISAGDTIYVASTHSESIGAGSVTLSSIGTLPSGIQCLSVSTAAEPPTTLVAGATITKTGDNGYTIQLCGYMYGIYMTSDSSGTNQLFWLMGGQTGSSPWEGVFDSCRVTKTGASTFGPAYIGQQPDSGAHQRIRLINCDFKFSTTSQFLPLWGEVEIRGGSILSGSSTPTNGVFVSEATNSGVACQTLAKIYGFDFSNLSSSVTLIDVSEGTRRGDFIDLIDCKVPASWSGALISSSPPNPGEQYRMWNTDSTGTNYRVWFEHPFGTVKTETTLVKTGGSTDGATPISWKLTTPSRAAFPAFYLITPEFVRWNNTTGVPIVVYVDFLHDSVTALKDTEIWLEVMSLNSSGAPLGTWTTSGANALSSGISQPSSNATWTTTGMTNPNKQRLVVQFTPQLKGFIHARACLAKASYTVYLDLVLQMPGGVIRSAQIPGGQYINEEAAVDTLMGQGIT